MISNAFSTYGLVAIPFVSVIIIMVVRALYPKPYPDIPHNKHSANRVAGDIPDLVPLITSTNEFSNSMFTITTQKLGTPIAQFLFPGIRKPLIILEDPREIEDLLLRRNKEFDKAPMALSIFQPMFPKASLAQFTTPELKAQKRLWADVMAAEFLNKATAPRIRKATLGLVELWRLRVSVSNDKPFAVHEDLQNTTLDGIWVSILGDEAGIIDYSIKKLRSEIDGSIPFDATPPRGGFLREEVRYISDTIARLSNTPSPKWAGKIETYTPRYRRFRSTVIREISLLMAAAIKRFQDLDVETLNSGDTDRCMLDLVLRRLVLQSRKINNAPLVDPTKDQNMLDELFIMLVGGHDSTANTLCWFVRFMEAYPAAQSELRTVLRAAFPGPEPPSAEAIIETNVPYLDAVVEEGFRLAGAAKGNLRQALVETSILGYHIPKGAEIFMNYHINRSPAPVDEAKRSDSSQAAAAKHGDGLRGRAGYDLDKFEPRRYLVKDPDTGKETFNSYAIPSLAFGGGYRGCTGRKLATLELRIFVTLLILNFEFTDLPEEMRSMAATEKIFRQPDMPFARVKVL
ncbi:unnamed protein product [Clonostachys chloroleuca]|uniref:Cytochrome P450 n=1 Tax=Clonostachys chloroleuca TaxID=1926264 RepID=A0AA35MA86_9HYPO|nr:unnamed protein product [Clonostachys chloroleuca]